MKRTKRQNQEKDSKITTMIQKCSSFEGTLLKLRSDPTFVPKGGMAQKINASLLGLESVDLNYTSSMLRRFGGWIVDGRVSGKFKLDVSVDQVLVRNFGVLIRLCLVWIKGAKPKNIYYNSRENRLIGVLPNALKLCEKHLLRGLKETEEDPWDGVNKGLILEVNNLLEGVRMLNQGLLAEHKFDSTLSSLELRTLQVLSLDFGTGEAKSLMNHAIAWSHESGVELSPRASNWYRNRASRIRRRRKGSLSGELLWSKNPEAHKFGLPLWMVRSASLPPPTSSRITRKV
jgi:hypothetical protein